MIVGGAMKKIIYILLCTLLAFFGYIILNKYNYINSNNITIEKQGLKTMLVHKGLKGAVDFVQDENSDFYIAYDRSIQYINKDGRSFDILRNTNYNITSIDYYKGNLYIALGTEVMELNPRTGYEKIVLSNLPNLGDYNESFIKVQNDCLYITIGSSTNSGVCGSDNEWIRNNPYGFDITPKDITLRGLNFGDEKTGAFVPYKTKNAKGQIIPGHFPGNGTLIIYYLTDNFAQTYAWGIRNITGIDFTSTGKVIAAVGGMEDRGLRPVRGDTDYIYEIRKDTWYGWPDYSGGDPITSPKFKGKNGSISFILDNHVSTNPPAPIYQHNSVSTLKGLAVDRAGYIGDIDNIYFYDLLKNEIFTIGKTVIPVPVVKIMDEKSKITGIKFSGNSLFFLDANSGTLYKIFSDIPVESSILNKKVIIYLLTTVVLGIIIIVNIKR